ncbi:MAG: aminotransferase class I/II-fold pyridoxal phosphate-dependent enzyme, partial [Eudoraea sp.]|nr:aminotransferase class I/II-fold pyridoxal phosphate-dependent enzyme [Eudoraea sp.]
LIIRGFLDENSECIYCSPYFNAYKDFSEVMGAKTIDIPLLGENFDLDIPGIDAAITEKTSVIFITSPNNPTGSYIRKAQVDALLDILPDHVLLVFDEVYYQYADAEDYVRALPYVLENKNVIAINSLSKAYGLAGLRIGYSYSTPEVANYLQKFRIPFMLNTLSMEAAIAGIQDDEFIERTVDLIHKEKYYLYKELDVLGTTYWKTQANFILMRPQMTPQEFEAKMIEEGIMVRPLVGFGAPDCVRVTIGTHEANEAFIDALKKIS